MKKHGLQLSSLTLILLTTAIASYATDAEVTTIESLDGPYVVTSNLQSNSLSFCPITESTGALNTCTLFTPAVNGSNLLSSPAGSIFDASTNTLYVANQGNDTVTICTYSSSLSSATCQNTQDSTFNTPSAVAVSADGSYLYVTNGDAAQSISSCPLYSSGDNVGQISGSCTSTQVNYGDDNGINNVSGIAVLNNSIAYATTASDAGQLSTCTIANSMLNQCNYTYTPTGQGYLEGATGIALTADGDYLYAGSAYHNHVTLCPTDDFSACYAIYDDSFILPATVALYTAPSSAGGNTYLYVASYGEQTGEFSAGTYTVSICPVVNDILNDPEQTSCTAFTNDPSFSANGNQNLNGITVIAPA